GQRIWYASTAICTIDSIAGKSDLKSGKRNIRKPRLFNTTAKDFQCESTTFLYTRIILLNAKSLTAAHKYRSYHQQQNQTDGCSDHELDQRKTVLFFHNIRKFFFNFTVRILSRNIVSLPALHSDTPDLVRHSFLSLPTSLQSRSHLPDFL